MQETVSKYKVKFNDGRKEYTEEIEVDAEKQTEIFHIPEIVSSNAGQVDVIFEFTKVKYMCTDTTGRQKMVGLLAWPTN